MNLRDRLEAGALRLPVPARRLGYRLAYTVLFAGWILTGRVRPGVKCVIVRDHEVLLVRHTYGSRRWELPGGTIAAGEVPLEAARREMREELGVELSDLRELGDDELHPAPRAHGTVHYVRGTLAGGAPRPDPAEIAEACFHPRTSLPAPLGRDVRRELALLNG